MEKREEETMEKKRRILCAVMCLLMLISPVMTAGAEAGVAFTDDLGREVTVAEHGRTASLLGSFAEIWMLAGGEIIAAPDDAWEDLKLDLPEEAVNLGDTKSLSLEKLFEADPDFILASVNTRQNVEWQAVLENTDIPTAYFDVNGFADYLRILDIFTDITGRKDLYEKNGLSVQGQIDAALERSRARLEENEAPSVLVVMASASMLKVKRSEGSVLGEMLKELGCVNIADSEETLLENLSIERIYEADPDYIFFVQRGNDEEGMKEYVQKMLSDSPIWSILTAVKEEHVFFMEKNLYGLKPNHRWGEAYEKLEDILDDEK